MNIPKTMKALVAYSKTDYRYVEDFPVPECGPDDILIKTEGCGICAGDLKCQHGADMFWGSEDGSQPAWVEPPFIPGHEFLGKIVYVGENVKDHKLGDRIAVDQIAPCGECRFCKDGHYWMCQPHKIYGFFNDFCGGMAEYVRIPTKHARIYDVPEELTFEQGICIEPYGCSKHCVDRAQIGSEDIVVLSGAGTLGLGMVTYAKQRGPKTLIVLDMKDDRLEKAKEFGADIVWNPSKVNVVEEIMKLTDGYGCDIYIEAPTTLDWSIIGDRKELDVLGSHLSPYCFPYVIENIANGKLKTDGVVSRIFELKDWETAFEYATGKYGDFKVAFKF